MYSHKFPSKKLNSIRSILFCSKFIAADPSNMRDNTHSDTSRVSSFVWYFDLGYRLQHLPTGLAIDFWLGTVPMIQT